MVTSTDIKAIHERLRGAPRHTNLIAEKKRRARIQALEEERERAQAAAREAAWIDFMKQEAETRRVVKLMKTAIGLDSFQALQFEASARFQDEAYGPVEYDKLWGLSMEQIAQMVLVRYPGTTLAHVREPCRESRILAIRKEMACAIKAADPAASIRSIARFLHRDRSTVLNLLKGKERGK